MAVKVLTPADIRAKDSAVVVTPEIATVAADGFEATITGNATILIENVSAATPYDLTIKYGNAMQGVADKVVTVAGSTSQIIPINTGGFKNMSGTNVGKILMVPGHVDLHVKVLKTSN